MPTPKRRPKQQRRDESVEATTFTDLFSEEGTPYRDPRDLVAYSDRRWNGRPMTRYGRPKFDR